MTKEIAGSELILNPDGSVYHLCLLPEDVADNIILVGDPDRVSLVSSHFDSVEVRKQKREFVTHTGHYSGTRISVISTGIGTDNIDIVLNELDLLVNVDLQTKMIKAQKRSLRLIRIGTSGAMQADIPIDSILISEAALGLDNVLWFYGVQPEQDYSSLATELQLPFLKPYLFVASNALCDCFPKSIQRGLTVTCTGFYGPQGRELRLPLAHQGIIEKLSAMRINGMRPSNFEMESSAIFGLSNLFGFEAVSVNAIVANRITQKFSQRPHDTVERAIQLVLEHCFKR